MTDQVRDLVQQGVELISAQRYPAARETLEKALEIDKKNYDAYMHLGSACVNMGQYEDGLAAFKKALLLKPASGETVYSLACTCFLSGNNVDAIKYFNQCEEMKYGSAEMYGLMEVIFVGAKDFVQALRCANKAIQIEPLNPRPYIDKAQIYLMQGKRHEAITCLREVEALLPDAGDPYLIEAQIFMQEEEYDQALSVVERAIGRFPEDAAMMLMKARILNSQGKYEDSLACNAAAKGLVGDNAALMREFSMQESISYAGLKDAESSSKALEGIVSYDDQDAEAWYLLINEAYALAKFEKVIECAKKMQSMTDIEPRYRATAIFMNAMALKEIGREEEAILAFREAVGALRQITIGNPGLLDVYAYRLLVYKELGEYEKALPIAEHLINIAPDNAVGYAFEADILEAQGLLNQAKAMREKVREIDPEFKM